MLLPRPEIRMTRRRLGLDICGKMKTFQKRVNPKL
ncbi:Uncharacterised protein [Bordetella pertussis]|nr:Uncharacterised protein [Bordetella pertussis]